VDTFVTDLLILFMYKQLIKEKKKPKITLRKKKKKMEKIIKNFLKMLK